MVSQIIYYCIVTTSMHFNCCHFIPFFPFSLPLRSCLLTLVFVFAELFYGSSTEEPLETRPSHGGTTSSVTSHTHNMKPSFTKRLKFQSVLEGEAVELKCELLASPPPSILWFHNNKSIPNVPPHRISSASRLHVHTSSLVIDRVKEKDSGSYKVMAINNEGSAESTASLLVSMQEEQSANYLSCARHSAKAPNSTALSAENRQERTFRVDLRCVGSPFDQRSKARLARSRSEASLVRSVYFRSSCYSKERASTEKPKLLETASERALSPPPMFDRSERFNDRFSDIYCDRRTGARFSDRFSDTESLHNEVRTKLNTLQKAVKQRKRLSISTMSSSEFELESVASEPSYVDYVERLRVRPAFLHEAPHFNRHFELGESQQECQSKGVSTVPAQASARHSFEPQSRTRAIQIMRGELVDTLVDKNGESLLESQKDDASKQEVSKRHRAVAEKMMEDSYSTFEVPYPEGPDSENSFYPEATIYPERAESTQVVITDNEASLKESPTPKQVTTLTPDYTDSVTPEDKEDSVKTNLVEGESFRSPCEKDLESYILECEQSREWQQCSKVSKEIFYHEMDLPNPTKRVVENRESVGPETTKKTKAKFGDTEGFPTGTSTRVKASLLEEDRGEEMVSEVPLLAKQMSPRLNIKTPSLKEEFLPKGEAKMEHSLEDSSRPSRRRSTKERFLSEPELPTILPSDTYEPYQEPCGGESLKTKLGKSLEAERIQCEEKLLALRIRKWQQGMQMSEDEPHYPESDQMLANILYMESEGHMYPEQEVRAPKSLTQHADAESPKHVEDEPPPTIQLKAEKMLAKTGEKPGLHLSRDNISELKHESERFFSEDEALAQRIMKWQQDVLNEQEQAAKLESNRAGAYPQIPTETVTETGQEATRASSEFVPQLNSPSDKKSSSTKSAKEKFLMGERSDKFQELHGNSKWLQTDRRETMLQRDSEDFVNQDKVLAAEITKRQQDVGTEPRAKIESESHHEGKGHPPSFHREDDLGGVAQEHYSLPILSSSAHATEALLFKPSISQPVMSSESDDMRMRNRQKKDQDTVFDDKTRSQCSTDIRVTVPENHQQPPEGVSGTKAHVDPVTTVERQEYRPMTEGMFVQESRELIEEDGQTQKRREDDAGAAGSPPFFVKEISSLKSKVGEMSEFTCQFHGDPLPTVTWFKDGDPLAHNPDFDIVDRANRSKLTLFYPTTDHEGTYDCVVTNKYGTSVCSCTLEIADKARMPDVSKEAVRDPHKRARGLETSLQVPQTEVHRQLCSDETSSPVEIRITTATPVPGIPEETTENKPQDWIEEMSTVAAAEGSSKTGRHKFTFAFDVAAEEPTGLTKLPNTNDSEGITGDVKHPETFHQEHQDTTQAKGKSVFAQPEKAARTQKAKHAVSSGHPGLSGCGLPASSTLINVSEIKQAFEFERSVPVKAPHKKDRKETFPPEECLAAVPVSTDLKEHEGEMDPRPVDRHSSPNLSPGSPKTVLDGEEDGAATQSSPASGELVSDESVSPQLAAPTTLISSEGPQPSSHEENGRQASPQITEGAVSTEDHGGQIIEMVQESLELVSPKKPAPSPKQEPCEMQMGMPLHTFDRTSSFIPFVSEKENRLMRTSAQPQATVKPKRTSGSFKPESQSAAAMSSSLDSELDAVREVVPTHAEEAGVLEASTEVKDQIKLTSDRNIVAAVMEHTKETSSASTELTSTPKSTLDSGVFLSEVDTQPNVTTIAEEAPGYEGELEALNNGQSEQEMVDDSVISDPQPLMVNPKVANVPGQHHLSEDGETEGKVTSTQKIHLKSSETEANVATAAVGSLEEEEVTFGAVYDYYNLPAEWGRPMSPESEMSIEFGSTVSEEIPEVAERFFTPGSSTEVLHPRVESFNTPTSPMEFHTPTSVSPGGFMTPQEYPFNPTEAKSPSSREPSERFFTPLELLSSPVEWSMDTTAADKNSVFTPGTESSSLAALEEKVQGVPPAFLKPLMKKRVCENDSLTFFAEVFGLPCPEVKWFFNKTQLVEDDRVKMERDDNSISLTVLDVTKADQGEYICEAVNAIGEARSVALVVVVSQEVRFMPAPPAVTHQHVMEFDVEEDDSSRSPSPQEILLEVELDENEVKEFEKQVKIITIPEYTADNKSMIVSLDVLPSIYEEGAVDFITHEHDDLKIAFEVTEMPPRFVNPICDMETPEGTTIIFECSVMGTPSPVVSWFKGDKRIPHNNKKYLHSSDGDNHFLKICTVTTQDSGVYICRAINVVGETLCRASLVVVNAKSFLGRTRGREVTAVSLRSAKIQPQKFDLMVGGTSFDGEQVSEIELEFEFDQEADESQRAVRLVANTDHHSETGEQGEKYVSINFDVFAEPAKEEKVEFKGKSSDMCSFQFQVTESPPKCIIPLTNITAAVGTPVILQCLVSGTPSPTAEWYKDGDRVTDSRCIIQEKSSGHFNLLITNVTQSDAGEYKCLIQNAAGCSETSALLKVF